MESAPETRQRLFNHRPMFAAALALMLGIAAAGLLEPLGAVIMASVLIVSAAVSFILRYRRIVPFILLAALGLLLAVLSLPTGFTAGMYTLQGTVVDCRRGDEGTVLVLKNVTLNGESINKRAELTLKQADAKVGDRIESSVYARLPSKRFGTYDELKNKLASGVGCIARSDSAEVLSSRNEPLTEFVSGVREAVERRISNVFESDAGIFSALILGNKQEIGEERYSVFRLAGTAHLLAISGFHMGIAASCITMLIPRRRKLLRLVITSIAMLVYCTVAAYAPGFVRAAIMMFFVLLADCLGRQSDMLSSLGTAAVLILVFEPYQLYSVGFRLSFAACFGIALLARSLGESGQRIHIPRGIASAAAASTAAVAGTFALQLRYYSSFSPYTVITNLVAIPLFAAVVVLGLIATAVAFIFLPAAQVIAVVPRAILFVCERFMDLMNKLPLATAEFAPCPIAAVIIWLTMLFCLSEYTLLPLRRRAVIAVSLFALFTAVYVIGIAV